jgi:hypothetical protein
MVHWYLIRMMARLKTTASCPPGSVVVVVVHADVRARFRSTPFGRCPGA